MSTASFIEPDDVATPLASAVPRVLIVEDEETIQELLLLVFQREGFETSCASTVAEAMEHLNTRQDFCTLDLNLPDGQGTEVLHRIRAERRQTKVTVTTGSVDKALLAAVAKLKPDRIIQKPFNALDLVAWIRGKGKFPLVSRDLGVAVL